MTGQVYINDKDISIQFGAELIGNSFSNLLLKPNMKEYATNNLRSHPGEQVFIADQTLDARDVEVTFLIKGSDLNDYLSKLEALTAEIDKGEIALRVTPLKTIYNMIRKSYLSLDPYRGGSVGKLVVSMREPNPKNRQ